MNTPYKMSRFLNDYKVAMMKKNLTQLVKVSYLF